MAAVSRPTITILVSIAVYTEHAVAKQHNRKRAILTSHTIIVIFARRQHVVTHSKCIFRPAIIDHRSIYGVWLYHCTESGADTSRQPTKSTRHAQHVIVIGWRFRARRPLGFYRACLAAVLLLFCCCARVQRAVFSAQNLFQGRFLFWDPARCQVTVAEHGTSASAKYTAESRQDP